MFTSAALCDAHERTHRSLRKLIAHCGGLEPEALAREFPGFGYPTVPLQLHHGIAAERYWVGVLQGKMLVDHDAEDYSTIAALEAFREMIRAATEGYLAGASSEELNTPRTMVTWRQAEQVLMPAHVILRTMTHHYQHQGQIVAMCRLLGKPIAGTDFPIL